MNEGRKSNVGAAASGKLRHVKTNLSAAGLNLVSATRLVNWAHHTPLQSRLLGVSVVAAQYTGSNDADSVYIRPYWLSLSASVTLILSYVLPTTVRCVCGCSTIHGV
ncbi:hypothetical protein J6590_016306 [Homalodisca vitripennis]|nr:hypothetical protein J6590_016306 [Homalodisca vitripennis]